MLKPPFDSNLEGGPAEYQMELNNFHWNYVLKGRLKEECSINVFNL